MNRDGWKWKWTILIVLLIVIDGFSAVLSTAPSNAFENNVEQSRPSVITGQSRLLPKTLNRKIRAADAPAVGKSTIDKKKTTETIQDKVHEGSPEQKKAETTKLPLKNSEVIQQHANVSETLKENNGGNKVEVKEAPKKHSEETQIKNESENEKKTDKDFESNDSDKDFDDELNSKTIVKTGLHAPKTLFIFALLIIGCYLCYHNKNKVLGMIVEGRPGGGHHGRRSGTVRYRPLDTDDTTMESGIY